MKPKPKNKIVIFLSDETLTALNKKSELDEQSRSSVCSQIIKKAVERFKISEQ